MDDDLMCAVKDATAVVSYLWGPCSPRQSKGGSHGEDATQDDAEGETGHGEDDEKTTVVVVEARQDETSDA